MNQEPFHVMSQDWRYFSRQKSLITTVHLGQLVNGSEADTVLIKPTSPVDDDDTGGHYSVPPLILPPTGKGGGGFTLVYNQLIGSSCFGCVAWDKTILAQRNMDISISPWDDNLIEITMTPKESGWYLAHIEVVSDVRGDPYNYQGPSGNGGVTAGLTRSRASSDVLTALNSVRMEGVFDATHWRPAMFIKSIVTGRATGMVVVGAGQPMIAYTVPGDITTASLSMWMFKVAEVR